MFSTAVCGQVRVPQRPDPDPPSVPPGGPLSPTRVVGRAEGDLQPCFGWCPGPEPTRDHTGQGRGAPQVPLHLRSVRSSSGSESFVHEAKLCSGV